MQAIRRRLGRLAGRRNRSVERNGFVTPAKPLAGGFGGRVWQTFAAFACEKNARWTHEATQPAERTREDFGVDEEGSARHGGSATCRAATEKKSRADGRFGGKQSVARPAKTARRLGEGRTRFSRRYFGVL